MALSLQENPFFLDQRQIAWVEDTLAGLSPEEKLGQLFCIMGGDYAPETLRAMVAAGKVGAILFRPVKPCEGIRADFAPLDTVAKVPLLKAANLEEGGSGGMSDGTLFGWPMLIAATDDAEMAGKFGAVCATEGRKAGINWTFSPVCDLDLNPQNPITNVRTFGSDPKRVKTMTEKYMCAVQSRGIAAAAKHFPGDGVDYRDQHLHPTYNTLSADAWYRNYGEVYRNLIRKGLLSVMAGHIGQPNIAHEINPDLSEEELALPASLSKTLLTDLLRGRLNFNGVITSDATIMGGFCMAMPRREAIPSAIMAGCDMLVFNTDFEEDYGFAFEALQDGRLSTRRLDEAVTRILALKAKVCFEAPLDESVPAARWHEEVMDRAITLVKSKDPDVLPVSPKKTPRIRLITLGRDDILDGSIRTITREYLEAEGFTVENYDPYADDLHGVGDLPKDRLTLYMTNFEQASNQTVVRIPWCPKHALDMPRFLNEETCIFVSMANPYLLQDVPRVRTYINTYTATRTTIRLLIDKLMGRGTFRGSSPVDAFCGLPDTRL